MDTSKLENLISGYRISADDASWLRALMSQAEALPKTADYVVERLGEQCIDGGKCHDRCKEKCLRRRMASPLPGYTGPWRYRLAVPGSADLGAAIHRAAIGDHAGASRSLLEWADRAGKLHRGG